MARYAKGKRSYGMSDRGGHRVRYTQLKTTWDGLRVAPDEWEPKHPQLTPPKNVIDATALFKPRPSSDAENVTIFIAHTFDPFADPRTRKTVGVAGYGNTNRVDNEEVRSFPQPSGVGGTGAVGVETFETSITETGLGGTGGVGTETGVVSLTETGVGGTGGVGTESVTVNQEWGSGSWNDGAWGE